MTAAEKVRHGESDGAIARPRVDSFLEAKLHPPDAREAWISRLRLVRALEDATDSHVVTLVAAPAGYGKTTIVAQWLTQLKHRQLAWVALDADDNDPIRLWTHIATALERAGCTFAEGATNLVRTSGGAVVTELLPHLVDAMAAAPAPIVLVLDDFHFVTAGSCHEQVDFFLRHLPSSTALVVLTRADPALRLGRLRAAGQLAEIRTDQLAFDANEARALLAVEGVQLSEGALTELLTRTEGWPAGLYLATLSLAGREDPDAFVHAFSGDNRFIGDYLIEEVLGRRSDDLRTFILSVSIFERFSARLCDCVLDTVGSSRVLHDLERSNLFLVPLDANRQWFRFHHLFSAVARSELEAEDPARLATLHDRAAHWFDANGFVDEAVRHAIASGSTARASRLVEANWMRYVDAGRSATVERWLESLRVSIAEADPAALVTAAWMAVVRGDEATLDEMLGLLDGLSGSDPLPDGTRSVESAVALIRGLSGYGGPVQMQAAAERAVALETDPASPWTGFARFALGHARYIQGDLDGAMKVLPEAAYAEKSFAIIRQFAFAAMSMVAREQGASDLRRLYAHEARTAVDGELLRASPQASMALTVFGQSQADDGYLSEALVLLEEGLQLRRRSPGLSPWPTIYHLITMGRVCAAAGDLPRADGLLGEASQMMSRFPYGMDAMRSRLAEARTAVRRRQERDGDGQLLTERELDVLRLLQGPTRLGEIAAELFLSPNTVKTHAQAIYRKLGASSRSEAVRIAHRRALI